MVVIQDTEKQGVIRNVPLVPTVPDVKRRVVNIALETEIPVIMLMVHVVWVVILDSRGICVWTSVMRTNGARTASCCVILRVKMAVTT